VEKLLIFAGMALVTYATRYTMIAALGRQIPSVLERWLRYVPPAVLAALIVPAVLAPKGHLEMGLPVWAALVGALVAWRTRSVLWTMVGGMAAFWVLKVIAGQ
jgi:branched-subunit amino acid transport protein